FHITALAFVHARDPFSTLDATTMKAVSTGVLGAAFDDTASSGESVLHGDFSALTAPGRYVVSRERAPVSPFAISGDLYRPLFRDALRAFYLIRCGVAIDDAETGIQHNACELRQVDARGRHRGEQHALTLRAQPGGASSVSTGTARANDGTPDLLD